MTNQTGKWTFHTWIAVSAILMLGACADDGVVLPGYYAGAPQGDNDGCGVASQSIPGGCQCLSGYQWCDPDDRTNFNCCLPGGTGDARVFTQYDEPSDPRLTPVMDWLVESEMHDIFAEGFTGWFDWVENVGLVSTECGAVNALYGRFGDEAVPAIVMCYELWGWVHGVFADNLDDSQAVTEATVSTWVFILFHELGHALVDVFDLPIVAAEEDAVDALSTVLLIEGGQARAAVQAAAFWFYADDQAHSDVELADEHSLHKQRFYNVLCLVYGSDPATWHRLAEVPELASRIQRCPDEYASARDNWNRLLAPHR